MPDKPIHTSQPNQSFKCNQNKYKKITNLLYNDHSSSNSHTKLSVFFSVGKFLDIFLYTPALRSPCPRSSKAKLKENATEKLVKNGLRQESRRRKSTEWYRRFKTLGNDHQFEAKSVEGDKDGKAVACWTPGFSFFRISSKRLIIPASSKPLKKCR